MTKTYTLLGLDCANCASKIEASIKKLRGVSSATVNYMNATLHITVDDEHSDHITRLIEDSVHKHEAEIMVIEKDIKNKSDNHEHDHSHDSWDKAAIIKLVVGSVIFGIGILLGRIFAPGSSIPLSVFIISYLILGGKVVLRALKNISRGQIFDENFLMSIATIGAFIIGDYPEAVAVMLFFQIGELFQDLAVRRAKKSITDLMDIRADFANLKTVNGTVKVAPDTVRVGDIIVVKPGEKVPLDGIVIDGESMLDAMALTGESLPRKASVSDAVLSGCINQNGVLTIEVTKPFGESTVAKIIDLVENAGSKKAPTENFITTFSRYYTPIVVGLAALIAVVPPLFMGAPWSGWVNRGLIFLVISCPCALVISIPLGFFGGIGGASKRGVLIKGSNYLDALTNLDIVVFDKTGTLTRGVFKVTRVKPQSGIGESELLEFAAKAEAFSNHPIALSIQKAYGGEIEKENLTHYNEISGHGVSVNVDGKLIYAGNHKLMELQNIDFTPSRDTGTKVYVAVDNVYLGCIIISDEIKPDSHDAIAALKAKGVRKAVMLTGDNPKIAQTVANELKLDEVYGGLLPAQKVEKVELLTTQKRANGKLAFVGDGINDAPVLARADIGVAMGGLGSDAAIEAADIVLMSDEPSKLADAIDTARFTKRVVWQNIVFALGIKGIFLLLGALGIATMWEAVFADVGVSVIAILNATRVMRMK